MGQARILRAYADDERLGPVFEASKKLWDLASFWLFGFWVVALRWFEWEFFSGFW